MTYTDKQLAQIFENNFNCWARLTTEKPFSEEQLDDSLDIMAMDKTKFISIVKQILDDTITKDRSIFSSGRK